MHISDQVKAALLADGWKTGNDGAFRKTFETGGSFGRQTKTLAICELGRWFDRLDGWGRVEKDVDLRDHPDSPLTAIAAVLA